MSEKSFIVGPKRRPDYYIRAKPRSYEGLGGKVGAAWINEDKSITIKLETCTVLFGNDDLLIRMFPVEKTNGAKTVVDAVSQDSGENPQSRKDNPF